MKVTQEKLPASQIGLEIEIPSDRSQKTYDRVLQNLKYKVPLPGFRKGKISNKILIQRLGQDRIKAAALEEMIQETLQEAIDRDKIEAIGNYQLRSNFEELLNQYKPGQPLTFSAKVDVSPDPQLSQYESLEIQAEEVPYDPAQVDSFLEARRSEHATLIPIEDRSAQMGDVAILDFEGRLAPEQEGEETEPFQGGTAEDFEVELVEGKLIPGFVEQMVDMKLEETKDIQVRFPDEYEAKDLAGKPAIFSVTLKDLKEKELPELDDDFAQEISEFETLAELRESLESRFKSEAQEKTEKNIKAALLKALLDRLEVELPETLIKQEVDTVLTQQAMQLQQYGIDVKQFYTQENVPQMRENAKSEAITRLKKDLALNEIARQQALEPTAEEIAKRKEDLIEELAGQQVDPDRLQEFVTSDLRKEAVMDWLKERAQIEFVPESPDSSVSASAETEESEETVASETSEAETSEATSESKEAETSESASESHD